MIFRFKAFYNVLFNLLLTYVVIILVVASFFYPVYTATLKTVKESTVKDSFNSLHNGAYVLDNEIIKMQDMATVLRNDNNFSKMINLTDQEIENEHHYIMSSARKFMSTTMLPSNILVNAHFLYKNNSIVISRDIVSADRREIYGRYFEVDGKSSEQWLQWVLDFNANDKRIFKPNSLYRIGNGIDAPSLSKQMITYILPLANEVAYNKDSALVCMLDTDQILELLSSPDIIESGFLTITDPKGQVILSYPSGREVPSYSEPGIYGSTLNNIETTVMVLYSSKSGLKITAGIPASVFTGRIENVMSMLRGFFLLSISLGLLAAFLFAYRNSLPIRKLMKTVVSISLTGERKGNAYKNIQDSFLELNKLKEGYKEEIDTLATSIKINLFDKLLKGRHNIAEEEEILRHLGFLSEQYFILVLRLSDCTISGSNSTVPQYDALAKVITANIIKEMLNDIVFIHSLLQDKVVVVLRAEQQKPRAYEEFLRALNQALLEIQEKTLTRIRAGISLVGKGPADVRSCYSQAMEILRMESGDQEEIIYLYKEEMNIEQSHLLEIKEVQKLYELLLAGEVLQVEGMLEDICQSILKKKYISDVTLRRIYYNIQNTILFAAKDLIRDTEPPMNSVDYSEDKSVIQLFDQLKDAAYKTCEMVDKRKKSKNVKLRQSVIEFLRSNYSNTSLSIALVAEQFGISEKYLCSFIKEQTGKSFGEYLEAIRLEQSMQLMKDSKKSIGKIAAAVGFNSQNTFGKVFKRVYGITPSAWREGAKD